MMLKSKLCKLSAVPSHDCIQLCVRIHLSTDFGRLVQMFRLLLVKKMKLKFWKVLSCMLGNKSYEIIINMDVEESR